MILFFGVPAENFEKGKEVLAAYKDSIAEVRVSSGVATNVYENFTEEIPAKFFQVLLKEEANNPEEIVRKLTEDFVKNKVIYPDEACWNVLIFNRDTF